MIETLAVAAFIGWLFRREIHDAFWWSMETKPKVKPKRVPEPFRQTPSSDLRQPPPFQPNFMTQAMMNDLTLRQSQMQLDMDLLLRRAQQVSGVPPQYIGLGNMNIPAHQAGPLESLLGSLGQGLPH